MLLDTHSHKPSIKNLVLMMIYNNTLRIVVLWCEESVHPARFKEPIMQHSRRIANFAEIVKRVAVELSYRILRDHCQKRLVERLDGNNNILHIRSRVLLIEDFERLMRVRQAIRITPSRIRQLLTTVIEPVLALRRTVQINDNL
jgi:hypothetical protein